MPREMIAIQVSENGKIETKDIDPSCATQKLYYYNGNGDCGIEYHCFKSKKDYYIKKAISAMKKDLDDEVKEATKKRDKFCKSALKFLNEES